MRKNNANQRSNNNKTRQEIMISHNPFNVRINAKYSKVLPRYTNILMPVTCVQGQYIEMSKKGVHLILKNNGVAIVKNGVSIADSSYVEFKKLVTDKSGNRV